MEYAGGKAGLRGERQMRSTPSGGEARFAQRRRKRCCVRPWPAARKRFAQPMFERASRRNSGAGIAQNDR